jgi:hypothetical protein
VCFHGTELPNAPEMIVCRPAPGHKSEGRGLPSTGSGDKALVANVMRREKQYQSDTRAMMKMIEVKRKVESREIAHSRHQDQVDLRSRPDSMKMSVFKILQPRPPTLHEIELVQRRHRMRIQKGVHQEILENHQAMREDFLASKRKERNTERRLALFAKDLYSIPNKLQPAMSHLDDLIQDEASGAPRPTSPLETPEVAFSLVAAPEKLQQTRTESQLPTLMWRRVDKIIHSRAQSAANAAVEERKTLNARMKNIMTTSVQNTSTHLREMKKADVVHEKRKLVAMKIHREQIDQQWDYWLTKKAFFGGRPILQGPQLDKRPATSHIDLRHYTRTPDVGVRNRVGNIPDVHMGAAEGKGHTSLALDGAARDKSSADNAAVRVYVRQGTCNEPKERERMVDERPVSAIARDRLLESSVDLAIHLIDGKFSLEIMAQDMVPDSDAVSPDL